MNIRKTGKSLNIKLTDTIKLLRFLENFISLDIVDGYLSYLGEKLVPLSSIKSDSLPFTPSMYWFQQLSITFLSLMWKQTLEELELCVSTI